MAAAWNACMGRGGGGIAVHHSPGACAPCHLQWQLQNFSQEGEGQGHGGGGAGKRVDGHLEGTHAVFT